MVADAGDPTVAGSLLDRYDPQVVVLVAGATPLMRPLQQQTWETFSVNWHTDVRIAFHWLREALLKPLRPGSRMVVISSGAAVAGSPLSGGYAGAKATQRFITGYAQDEANRAGLGITFTALLPRITPLTDLGRPAVRAYAARSGQSEEEYVQQFGEPLTPEAAGAAVVELVQADAATIAAGVPADRRRAAETPLIQPTSRAPGQGYLVAQSRRSEPTEPSPWGVRSVSSAQPRSNPLIRRRPAARTCRPASASGLHDVRGTRVGDAASMAAHPAGRPARCRGWQRRAVGRWLHSLGASTESGLRSDPDGLAHWCKRR